MSEPLSHPVARRVMRGIMFLFYLAAGFAHVTAPAAFLPIVPTWVPYPEQTIVLTGICELVGAVGLETRRFRWWSGVMLALYAVCVFPANLKHAFENIDVPQLPHTWWYHGPRLLSQPVIVWWALWSAGVIDWPFQRTRRATVAEAVTPS